MEFSDTGTAIEMTKSVEEAKDGGVGQHIIESIKHVSGFKVFFESITHFEPIIGDSASGNKEFDRHQTGGQQQKLN